MVLIDLLRHFTEVLHINSIGIDLMTDYYNFINILTRILIHMTLINSNNFFQNSKKKRMIY